VALCDADVQRFAQALAAHEFPAPVAHASYLINLGSSAADQWNKSLDALEIEWRRADSLRLSGLVMHPGAHLDATPEEGLANIVRGIELVAERVRPQHCKLLLENTAGQGSCLGWKFAELGWLIERLKSLKQIGICFDTCHAYAAGYDYSTPAKLKAMWAEFDQQVGLDWIQAIHLNDSQKGLGSRVDRHEHIGQGAIGEKALALFIKSAPVKELPMFLETEKGINEATGVDYDIENLQTLRRLVSK
jgi:deoxyribonuclease-4